MGTSGKTSRYVEMFFGLKSAEQTMLSNKQTYLGLTYLDLAYLVVTKHLGKLLFHLKMKIDFLTYKLNLTEQNSLEKKSF